MLMPLLQAHTSAQDKARIAVLYESGFRAGEFTALNVGSVQFEEREGGVWSAVLTLQKPRRQFVWITSVDALSPHRLSLLEPGPDDGRVLWEGDGLEDAFDARPYPRARGC